MEELKAAPEERTESAPDIVAKALDSELNAAASPGTTIQQTVVNDLTGIVKKKKVSESNGALKRKADEDISPSPQTDKKAKVEDGSSL